jgi:hypothetical protein
METKKVKNILLRLKLKGYGIVNYDGGDQKWVFNSTELNTMKTIHNNVTYAKKNFYKNSEGETDYKIKISSDCLKHSIFEKEIPFQSPNISHEKHILYSFIGSPAYILRGGFFEFGKGSSAFKRKAPFALNDAQQTCGAMSTLETFARSGKKKTDNSIDDKADNTFFKKETVGDIEYFAEGNLDLEQLQFVSTDIIFDRNAFNADDFDLFSFFLKTRIKDFNSKLGWYGMTNSVNQIPEYGFKFSNDNILSLVKHLFQSILELNIKRKGASAETFEFEYKLVYIPTEDTKYSEDGWVSVKSINDINSINFQSEDFYIEKDETTAKELRMAITENEKNAAQNSADIKQKVKDDIQSKKDKKDKKEVKEEKSTLTSEPSLN